MADLKVSEVQSFYQDKTIFLTGGTGFIGRLVIENLLRLCEVKAIYLLMRSNKGKNEMDRLQEIFNDVLFQKVKRSKPDCIDKLKVIKGDISKKGLDINDQDRLTIYREVQIIIHSAAIVKFGEPLKHLLLTNLRGTKDLLNIARNCENLKTFLYVSTAYSNSDKRHIKEKIYKTKYSADDLIHFSECFNEHDVEKLRESLVGEHPNAYTFSKFYAENLIKQYETFYPIAIIRPSIVIGTHKDPIAGWVGNGLGPTRILSAIGLGLLHTVRLKADIVADLVPADKVANAIVASGWYSNKFGTQDILILNCVTGPDNPVTLSDYMTRMTEYAKIYPSIKALGYIHLILVENKYAERFLWLILHFLLAYVADVVLIMSGNSPKFVNITHKLNAYSKAVDYFKTNDFQFDNHNMQKMHYAMSDIDKKLFNFVMTDFNWTTDLEASWLGMRSHYLKDTIETIRDGRRKQTCLLLFHSICISFLIMSFIFLIFLLMNCYNFYTCEDCLENRVV